MNHQSIGINDLRIILPKSLLNVELIVEKRLAQDPQLEEHLNRAIKSTGQKSIRFPGSHEDSVTLACQAAYAILKNRPLQNLRFITVGTETAVDHSKPISAYVLGGLRKAGLDIPWSLSTFQTQHACAGGSLAMLTIAAFLQVASQKNEEGLVLSTDIARYQTSTTAEITQGAGASAVILGKNPRLLELDLASTGFYSNDVDDFFRPLGQETAEVKGRFSVQCYFQAFQDAFKNYCQRKSLNEREALEGIDFFVLHTPFMKMAEQAMMNLLKRSAKMKDSEARSFLDSRDFYSAISPIADIGNMYNSSIFLVLAATLWNGWQKLGKGIAGKKILFGSYGSGNTMAVFEGVIAPTAPDVIKTWNLSHTLNHQNSGSFEQYLAWIERSKNGRYPPVSNDLLIEAGNFYLKEIREDGYREYDFKS